MSTKARRKSIGSCGFVLPLPRGEGPLLPPREGRGEGARRGFTLVELLVVIAIIGILVAMLLPAIQAAREAARRSQCQNNLKNIGLAFLNYESTRKSFPSGGWGWKWTGDPVGGIGERQPGGWAFSILPHLEDQVILEIGKGIPTSNTRRRQLLSEQSAQPVEVFYCPTRRPAGLSYGADSFYNADYPPGRYQAKTDYAANGGSTSPADNNPTSWKTGPGSETDLTCLTTYPNCSGAVYTDDHVKAFDGVVRPREPVDIKQITDGTSKTILVGEKYLHQELYGLEGETSTCSDNGTPYQGYDWDVIRWANAKLDTSKNLTRDYTPQHDSFGRASEQACAVRFGSAHPNVFQVVMCDGSISVLSYEIDMGEFEMMARRNDGGSPAGPPSRGNTRD